MCELGGGWGDGFCGVSADLAVPRFGDDYRRSRRTRHLWTGGRHVAGRHRAALGSQNLSTTSLLENREWSLALDTATAPDLIAAVESTFDADYAVAPAQ